MKTKTAIWLSVGAVVVGGVTLGLGIFGILEYSFHNSDLYKMSLERVLKEKQVVDAIGEPIQPKYFVLGSLNTQTAAGGSTGHGDLYYDVVGPRGKCEVYVTGDKDGVWTFTRLEVNLPGRDKNLVLESSENQK